MRPRRHMSFKSRRPLLLSHFVSIVRQSATDSVGLLVLVLKFDHGGRMSNARLLFSGRTTNNSGMMRDVLRNTGDPLRQQMFQIEYAQAPQLSVTQYLQPNLHLYLAHNSGLASFANDIFFWLVYRAPLTAETGLSRCWWINVTAMIVWTPCVKCEGSNDSHYDTSFATTAAAVWDPHLLRCPDKPTWKAQSMCASFALCLLLPGPIGIMRCRKRTERLLRVSNRAARQWVAQRRMTSTAIPVWYNDSALPRHIDSQVTKHYFDRTKRVRNKDAILDLECGTPVRSQRHKNWLSHHTAPADDCFTHQP
jgi:hypothetical protein